MKKIKDVGGSEDTVIDKEEDTPKSIDIRVDVARGGTSNNDDNEENGNDKKRKKINYDDEGDDEEDDDDQSTDSKDDSDLDKKPSVNGKNDDNDSYKYKDDDDDVDNDNYDDDHVPEGWMFNSYFAYILWGPFAEEKKIETVSVR